MSNLKKILFFYLFFICAASGWAMDIALLEKLTNAPAASGFEGPVRDILKDEWRELLEDLRVDQLGNLIGRLPSKQKKPRVLLMAHMDEVGFIVKEITDDGFILFEPLGDWIDPVLPAQKWIIATPKGNVLGYSGVESIHAIPKDVTPSAIPYRKIYLDIEARNKEEVVQLGIRPGLPITPATTFSRLSNPERFLAKAFDDRAALVSITEVLTLLKRENLDVEVFVAATVQEEVGDGMKGAAVIYDQVKPDIVINLDVGIARDFPLSFSSRNNQATLGKGPVVFVYDWSMIPNQKLVDFVLLTAQRAEIPVQYGIEIRYGQDGCCLQKKASGIPCINLGVPVRYVHSHAGIIDQSDFEQLTKLLVTLFKKLSNEQIDAIKTL